MAEIFRWDKQQVLTWWMLWAMFWFLLLSPRAGSLKIMVTDFGTERIIHND